jgi:hypothetical protein
VRRSGGHRPVHGRDVLIDDPRHSLRILLRGRDPSVVGHRADGTRVAPEEELGEPLGTLDHERRPGVASPATGLVDHDADRLAVVADLLDIRAGSSRTLRAANRLAR